MKNLFTLLVALLFSIVAISQETMKFQAQIENKNGDVLYIKDGTGKVIQEMKINPKGIFQAEFAVQPALYQLFDGVEYAQLFLKNGYDLKMTMNAAQFDQTIKFEGKGAKENNFLAEQTLAEQAFGYDKLLAMDEPNFTKTLAQKNATDTEKIDKSKLDPLLVQTLKNVMDMTTKQIQQYYTQVSANRKMNNSTAPNFDYENAAGGKLSLESLKGKYVYIDVWATWCGPCRGEIPHLQKVEEKYHGKNIEFVSISVDVDKDHEKWQNFVKEKQLGGTQLFADKNWASDFIRAFNINSIPRFILIDPKGVVVDADAARPSDPRLAQQLDTLLQ